MFKSISELEAEIRAAQITIGKHPLWITGYIFWEIFGTTGQRDLLDKNPTFLEFWESLTPHQQRRFAYLFGYYYKFEYDSESWDNTNSRILNRLWKELDEDKILQKEQTPYLDTAKRGFIRKKYRAKSNSVWNTSYSKSLGLAIHNFIEENSNLKKFWETKYD